MLCVFFLCKTHHKCLESCFHIAAWSYIINDINVFCFFVFKMEVCPTTSFLKKGRPKREKCSSWLFADQNGRLRWIGWTPQMDSSCFTKTRCAKLHKFCTKKRKAADVAEMFQKRELRSYIHILFVATRVM